MADRETFIARMDALKADMVAQGIDDLKRELEKLFKLVPDIGLIAWQGYTPYFNDGNDCVYRICGPGTAMKRKSNPLGEDANSEIAKSALPEEVKVLYATSPCCDSGWYIDAADEAEELGLPGSEIEKYYKQHRIVEQFFEQIKEIQRFFLPDDFQCFAVYHNDTLFLSVEEYKDHG